MLPVPAFGIPDKKHSTRAPSNSNGSSSLFFSFSSNSLKSSSPFPIATASPSSFIPFKLSTSTPFLIFISSLSIILNASSVISSSMAPSKSKTSESAGPNARFFWYLLLTVSVSPRVFVFVADPFSGSSSTSPFALVDNLAIFTPNPFKAVLLSPPLLLLLIESIAANMSSLYLSTLAKTLRICITFSKLINTSSLLNSSISSTLTLFRPTTSYAVKPPSNVIIANVASVCPPFSALTASKAAIADDFAISKALPPSVVSIKITLVGPLVLVLALTLSAATINSLCSSLNSGNRSRYFFALGSSSFLPLMYRLTLLYRSRSLSFFHFVSCPHKAQLNPSSSNMQNALTYPKQLSHLAIFPAASLFFFPNVSVVSVVVVSVVLLFFISPNGDTNTPNGTPDAFFCPASRGSRSTVQLKIFLLLMPFILPDQRNPSFITSSSKCCESRSFVWWSFKQLESSFYASKETALFFSILYVVVLKV
mmetsp:Transcript_6820/g.21227  ORF Transcript_6820/g.21227 Transcript_6820/m.21227 type:complete len:480 (-) Transcript_6820:46-1485(-)